MRVTRFWMLCSGGLALCSACTLLVDRDSLTNGRTQSTPDAGAGASSGSGGTSANQGGFGASECTVTDADIYCDGLDAQCNPTLQEAACPDGCTGSTLNGVSYMACTTSSSFDQAEVRCQAQRMHLVKIASASQNDYVVQLAQTLGSYVWVGGSNRGDVSSFAWPDGAAFYRNGAPLAGVYEHFGPNQPSSDASLDCVQIHDDASGFWLTARCADAEQFICERY